MFKRYWWMLLVMAPVGMIAGFLFASVVTYVMPKKYESFATIELKPPNAVGMDSGVNVMSPNYYATEFEKIKSRNLLMKVVDSLDLANKWGMDRGNVLALLRRIVRTQNIQGTDLITITVRHTDKEDARDITAEVAKAYKEYRKELESKSAERGISELGKMEREQEDKVEEKRNVLSSFPGIVLLDGSNLPEPSGTGALFYDEAKLEFEVEQALLEQMKLKLISAEIEYKNRAEYIVIHDDPVIADFPVSPNVKLNLVIGAVGGLFLTPFFALPLMWLLNRKNQLLQGRVDPARSTHF